MEGSTPSGPFDVGQTADRAVDPASFCGIAARMLAAGGRANIPPVLILLSQALRADVELQELEPSASPEAVAAPGASRSAIPQPRIRSTVDISVGAVPGVVAGVPMDLPVRSRGVIVAVLSVEPSVTGIPDAWAGTLATVADLLALTLAAEPVGSPASEPPASAGRPAHAREVAEAWFDFDEGDRADLAGHLHDGLVQSLIAARYLLDLAARAQPDGPQPWLATLRESLHDALADGRGLLTSLQPRTRHERGLRLALDEFCAGSRFPATLVAPPDHPEVTPQLSPVVAAAAYRFAQAAVADLRGRGAAAAEIRLAYTSDTDGGGLCIDVVPRPGPDGHLPELHSPDPGLALERWARRLDLLGGRIVLDPEAAHLCFAAADGAPAPVQEAAADRTAGAFTADALTADTAVPSASSTRTPLSAGRTK